MRGGWRGAGGRRAHSRPQLGERPQSPEAVRGSLGVRHQGPPLGSRRCHGAGARVGHEGRPMGQQTGGRTALTPTLDLEVDKYQVWEMGLRYKASPEFLVEAGWWVESAGSILLESEHPSAGPCGSHELWRSPRSLAPGEGGTGLVHTPRGPVSRRASRQPCLLAVTCSPLGLHRAFPCLRPPSAIRQPCSDAMGVQPGRQGQGAPAAAFCCHSDEVGKLPRSSGADWTAGPACFRPSSGL